MLTFLQLFREDQSSDINDIDQNNNCHLDGCCSVFLSACEQRESAKGESQARVRKSERRLTARENTECFWIFQWVGFTHVGTLDTKSDVIHTRRRHTSHTVSHIVSEYMDSHCIEADFPNPLFSREILWIFFKSKKHENSIINRQTLTRITCFLLYIVPYCLTYH